VRAASDSHGPLPLALHQMSRATIGRALIAANLLLSELGGGAAGATSIPSCAMHLSVLLTPDVPNPFDKGFLSSLIGNHPSYQLNARLPADGSALDVMLNGPGPNYRCQVVIDAMRKDARVLSIDVQPEPRP
jgi:hypothetical protein